MPVAFDTQRAVVAAGDGVVARFPGIICVAHCAEPGPVSRLLELCASASGPAPGRALARLLAIWMSGPDNPGDALRFGTVADAGEQLAVFLVGTVDAWVDGTEGTVLSGADAAIGTDRLLPLPASPVVLSLGDVNLHLDVDDVHNLRAGVVVGGGVVLHPAASPAAEPAERAAGPGAGSAGAAPPPAPAPDEGSEPVESSHDWFADLGSPAEPGADGAPAPERAVTAPAVPSASRNGAPPVVNGMNGSASWGWTPDAARPAGPVVQSVAVPPQAGPIDATGRHAFLDRYGRPTPGHLNGPGGLAPDDDEPTVGTNGHDSLGAEPDAGRPAPPALAETAFDGTALDGRAPGGTAFDGTAFDGTALTGETALAGPAPAGPALAEPAGEAALAAGPVGAPEPPTAVLGHDPFAAPAAAQEADAFLEEGDGLATPPAGEQAGVPWPVADAQEETVVAASSAPRTNGHPGDEPQVRGYACDQGHLNDPRAPFCVQCGAPIDDRTAGLVTGSRPSLGRLVFDDGATYSMDDGYLVGRMPESDDRVREGGLRPIILEDRTGSVSRVHAEIQVAGWDVMLLDAGSRNGTFVAGPDDAGWSPLTPQRGRRLLPGTRVRLGGRTFVFESTSGTR